MAKPRRNSKAPAQSCGTCGLFVRTPAPNDHEGSCRAKPIQLMMDGRGAFPPTKDEFWCGEWRGKA